MYNILWAVAAICLILGVLVLTGLVQLGSAGAWTFFIIAIVCAVLAYFLGGRRV